MNTRLKVAPVSAARAIRPAATPFAAASRDSFAPPRPMVLFVDDDPAIRALGKAVLTRAGYAVDFAADGAEAWEALAAMDYDLLVTDHQMPRMTGLELAVQVRRAGMRLPIIMTSGSFDPTREVACAWLNLAAFLPKPFTIGSLLDAVARVLPSAAQRQPVGNQPASSLLPRDLESRAYLHFGINE
jgi:CheY-like chemotaxis protein